MSFLLLQDGFALALEDGGYLLLEPDGGSSTGNSTTGRPSRPRKKKTKTEAKKKSVIVSRLVAQADRPPIADLQLEMAQQQVVALIGDQAAALSNQLMRQAIEADDEAIILKILQ